jgi:hypothetical protein
VHVVRSRYHHSRDRAASQIRYISHREEGLPGGERRELYAIGPRYRQLREQAKDFRAYETLVRQEFMKEAGRRRAPNFHMNVITVDDRAAAVLASMSREVAEQRLRVALSRTLRSSAKGRQLQGVFAIHWHGGAARAAHPHIHALYSPTLQRGRDTVLSKPDLIKFRYAWNREINHLVRQIERGRDRVNERALVANPVYRHLSQLHRVQSAVRSPARALAREVATRLIRATVKRLAEPERPLDAPQDIPRRRRQARRPQPVALGSRETAQRRLDGRPAPSIDVSPGRQLGTRAVELTTGRERFAPTPRPTINAPRRIARLMTDLARRASREI